MDEERENYPNLKEPPRETIRSNKRPITRLPKMWKILTAQLRKENYYSLVYSGGQKNTAWEITETNDLLYIDKHISSKKTKRGGKCSNGMNWQRDNKVFENVQNIRQNHKLHEFHGKLVGIINSRKSNPCRG